MLKQLSLESLQCRSRRKIVVLGGPMTKENHLLGIAKQYGLDKNCFEFCLSYDKAKKYQYHKLKNTEKYAAIIVGPLPHSTIGKGDYSSVITAMEGDEKYPPVFRVEKITGASFRSVLNRMIDKKLVAA